MTRSEYTFNGILTHVVIDYGDGTGEQTNYNPDGTISSVVALTGLEVFVYPPLDATGALATLLVVTGQLKLEDAANAVREEPEHLVSEALAWDAAQLLNGTSQP